MTNSHSKAQVQAVQGQIEDIFAAKHISLSSNQTGFTQREIIENHALLMTSFLLLATLMSLIVGGLGLMTTMSLNVLERTREIGVMRAIGASTHALLQIILTEGLLIGLLSWLLASVIVVPLSYGVANVLGQTLLKTSLDFVINPLGFILWLLVVLIFSVIASLPPAWNATRLTVRDVLAYE